MYTNSNVYTSARICLHLRRKPDSRQGKHLRMRGTDSSATLWRDVRIESHYRPSANGVAALADVRTQKNHSGPKERQHNDKAEPRVC